MNELKAIILPHQQFPQTAGDARRAERSARGPGGDARRPERSTRGPRPGAAARTARVLLAAAAVGLATASSASAQARSGSTPPRASQAFLMIGGSQLDLGELNTRLATHGYPSFDEQFLQLGGGLSFARERVLLGFEGAGLIRPSESAPASPYRTAVSAGYGMFNVGYAAFTEGGVWLTPKLGLGVGGVNLNISERAAPTFDELLVRPGRSVDLTNGSVLVDGSLALTYRLRPGSTARGLRGFAIGVRGGYTASVLDFGWSTLQQPDVPGGPAAGWGGPHVEFTIGRYTGRR